MAGVHSRYRLTMITFVAAAFVLSACGTTTQTGAPTSSLGSTPAQVGSYKVGKPYKISGAWYHPREDLDYDQTGIASWYGPGFHGRPTANGERYNQNDLTAAHPTLPMPSLVRVTNLENGRSVDLRINDRGPFSKSRIIDVSHRAAQLLGFDRQGTAKVRVKVLRDESIQLAAIARGEVLPPAPASLPTGSVQVAQAEPKPAPVVPAPVVQAEAPKAPALVHARSPMPDGLIHMEQPQATNVFIQAGAFTDYQNASQLASRLQPHGYVQIEPTAISGQSFYRVRIGPVESVDEADVLLARLISDGYTNSHVVVQ